MKEGLIVKSIRGHDEGRLYVVVSVVNDDFVLLADGKYRPLDNPKMKRVKHVKIVGETNDLRPDDAALRKLCNN